MTYQTFQGHCCILPLQAPDPSHALAVALDNEVQLVTLSTTVAKVSAELAEYKVESRAIKNQDLTIRKQVRVGCYMFALCELHCMLFRNM